MNRWVLIEETDEFMVCLGTFRGLSDAQAAIIEEVLEVMHDGNYSEATHSAMNYYEDDFGYEMQYKIKDYGKITFRVLESLNFQEQGKGKRRKELK